MSRANLKQYNGQANEFSALHSELAKVTNSSYFPRILPLIKGKRLLDLGCGRGDDLTYFQNAGAKIYGIDASKDMIALAKLQLPAANLSIGFNEELPYADNFFHVVTSKYVLQTSKNLDLIYSEVFRVLNKRGWFCFVMTHPIRQFMEKKKLNKDYFKKEFVHSVLFNGEISVREPTHTFSELLSPTFLKYFDLIDYDEKFDPSNAEMVEGSKYPAFVLVMARKR